MPRRTIAIGDIHGCAEALKALLDAIDPGPEDEIITLGDHIDNGPDSRGVIEQLLALGKRCRLVSLLGNHEEMLLGAIQGGHDDLGFWLRFGGEETLRSYGGDNWHAIPNEHLDFLQGCRLNYETDTHIFVHAGL